MLDLPIEVTHIDFLTRAKVTMMMHPTGKLDLHSSQRSLAYLLTLEPGPHKARRYRSFWPSWLKPSSQV